jgi:hypothetical protein
MPVGPDGSRRIGKDRLDDHRDDQGASDKESDGKQAVRDFRWRYRRDDLTGPMTAPADVGHGSRASAVGGYAEVVRDREVTDMEDLRTDRLGLFLDHLDRARGRL